MAVKKGKKTKNIRRRIVITAILALLFLLAGVFGYAALNAGTLHVMRAEVAIDDLPAAFEGRKILYISDIDLCGVNTAKRSADAVLRLQSLEPDILILGGDYSSPSLFEILNRSDGASEDRQESHGAEAFLRGIGGFFAPLGKFAVTAPDDRADADWNAVFSANGFRYLGNDRAPVTLNGEMLWIAGFCDDAANVGAAGTSFRRGDCVVAAAYSPALFPIMMTSEAADGGHWVDLALAGHTHGGQILLSGRSVLQLTSQEQQYLSGWTRETGVPMLTTSGMGCEGANLRIGSRSEAWLITLVGGHPPENFEPAG